MTQWHKVTHTVKHTGMWYGDIQTDSGAKMVCIGVQEGPQYYVQFGDQIVKWIPQSRLPPIAQTVYHTRVASAKLTSSKKMRPILWKQC